MPNYQEMAALIAEARRNERILGRMEQVENYLFSSGGLAALLAGLCGQVAGIYGLESVTLGLEPGEPRLVEALASAGCEELPAACFWISHNELRLMLGETAAPVLMADVPQDRAPKPPARGAVHPFPGRAAPVGGRKPAGGALPGLGLGLALPAGL